ncbi:BZ3500_MvSof-1268-A1-R1_Chr7-1g09409 [Microbotryum saponariae]|uniref:BZ3500_MvSof-1268-A1-R1_Chr7-1g09409 protein n=1 Tax=Microbotryum saponariae TaxID=289078 RepID=A0A2X0L152_9BASI|nr:BZ3501_MvSof-1269-A2-R1_Chr7-1g09114 [Microbotryum saponariae]SDA03385.1 BZ3500_MvSof-1268-A1-R1_Chr7-1g09409 [Microbotryum saponariae]
MTEHCNRSSTAGYRSVRLIAAAHPTNSQQKMRFLLVCSRGDLDEFRIPEIESIATLFKLPLRFEPDRPSSSSSSSSAALESPFVVIHLDNEDQARLLGSRSIGIKSIWQHWADAPTYEQLSDRLKTEDALWRHHAASPTTTWKFSVTGHGRSISQSAQRQVINTFSFMSFVGDIRLKDPDVEIGVFEEYASVKEAESIPTGGIVRDMRTICDTQRHMMDVFDVKKRSYIGNTTMESEVSLLMANQALASPGKFIHDPFAGTGSMLLTASAFGALTFGSDIDGRQMRGKNSKNVYTNAEQYGFRNRIVDCCSFDLTQHPLRTGELFDAIMTDPPYGVRAGAKRLGRKPNHREVLPTLVPGRESEGFHHQLPEYVPPSVPWEMSQVIQTLVTYSLYLLKPGGRLVFFLPTNNEEYQDVDVPSVPGLKLISNSSQKFGKWARRLITMEKSRGKEWREVIERIDRGILRENMFDWFKERQTHSEGIDGEGSTRKPGHAEFARRYFERFESAAT